MKILNLVINLVILYFAFSTHFILGLFALGYIAYESLVILAVNDANKRSTNSFASYWANHYAAKRHTASFRTTTKLITKD